MKRYLKEIIIIFIQLFMFYIFQLFSGPTDLMGMVFLIIITTFILALVLGLISNNKYKYIYPIFISIIFIPSILIYYNESALIHTFWYLVDSYLGILIASFIRKIIKWWVSNG